MTGRLKQNLDDLNRSIRELENQIENAKSDAENNIEPLRIELAQIKKDKSRHAMKSDFDSVQSCRRKENNLKFKIEAQWNEYLMLKNQLVNLNRQKSDLEYQIKLEEDKLKRKRDILEKMDRVLKNYRKTSVLKQAAIDSNIDPNQVMQWYEWGKNDFDEIYSGFYNKIIETDDYFKELRRRELKEQMDRVISAFKKTNSLEEASRIAGVSYDTVQYWYEWGCRGFGEENTYFFKNINCK